MKKKYISFQPNGARVYTNQLPPKEHPFVEDPDFSLVKKLHISKWTHKHFPNSQNTHLEAPLPRPARNFLTKTVIFTLGLAIGAVLCFLIK